MITALVVIAIVFAIVTAIRKVTGNDPDSVKPSIAPPTQERVSDELVPDGTFSVRASILVAAGVTVLFIAILAALGLYAAGPVAALGGVVAYRAMRHGKFL